MEYDPTDETSNRLLGELLQVIGALMTRDGTSLGAALDGGNDDEIVSGLMKIADQCCIEDEEWNAECTKTLNEFRPVLISAADSMY